MRDINIIINTPSCKIKKPKRWELLFSGSLIKLIICLIITIVNSSEASAPVVHNEYMSKQLSLANEIEMICLESLVYEHGENYKVIAKKLNCSRRKIFNMLNQRPSIRETAKSIKTPGVVCFKEHFKEKVEDLFKEREI